MPDSKLDRSSAWALTGVIASMLLVGVVSGTLIRHIIQIAPAIAVLGLLIFRGPGWTPVAIFGFWLFLMTLIWLFLLGIARVVSGTFSPAEITLTITVGISCLWGLISSGSAFRERWLAGSAAFLLTLGFQVGAMWLSFQPAFAHR
jgi:hypothetical protein